MTESRSDAVPEPPGSTSPPLPPGRYGTTGTAGSTVSGKVVAVVLILLVVALLVAGAFTVKRLTSTPDITGTAIAVTVVDEQRIDIVVDVMRDEPGTPVYCIVRALDPTKAEVGRREVYVPASEQGTVGFDAAIATTGRASSADVYGCGDDVPNYLRP